MHKISRSKLYQLVWDAPLTMVADRFNVTPTVLGRICDLHEIPRPGQGYWSRRVAGISYRPMSRLACQFVTLFLIKSWLRSRALKLMTIGRPGSV
jgi:hypothetical protein